MYERLKEFMKSARANEGLDAWNTDHDKVLQGFEDAMQQLRTYRESHGFTGATGDAMDRWVDASIERIKWYQSNYARGYESYEMGRQVMRYALAEAETISDDLLDAKTAAMRDDWVVSVPTRIRAAVSSSWAGATRPAQPTWRQSRPRPTPSARQLPRVSLIR